MKRETVLKKQSVRKKRLFHFWESFSLALALALKISVFVVALFVVSFLFLSLYEYLLTSHHIRLKEVIVRGVDENLEHELLERSKLNFDLSLLAINLPEVKRRMDKHPWVRSVQIKKQFPHTLVVQVERQTALALLVTDKRHYYLNIYGEVFKELDPSDSVDYPIVTGISADFSNEQASLKLAAQILHDLKAETGAWSLNDLSEIHIEPDGSVGLYSLSYAAVVKLKGTELASKKDELKKILMHLDHEGLMKTVKAIDLNYRDGAVVSFIKASS